MSWFDTAGFANLAKTALKEAQKTIDKALDITDEENLKGKKQTSLPSPTTSDANTDSFFSAWGLSPQNSPNENKASPTALPELTPGQGKRMTASTSLWGSFTGSFFENPNPDEESQDQAVPMDLVSSQPKKTFPSRSLSLELTNTSAPAIPLSLEEGSPQKELSKESEDVEKIREEIRNYPVEVVYRKREPRNVSNRLSVISSESDRRSSDSCDVLGSTSTPDSDPSSISTSSSVAKLRQSGSFESVEVLTSPSSVDVLGSTSSITSPGDPKYSSDSISPVPEADGVEVIPDDEEDVSVEDSYTSASETTLTVTVLEHGHHDPNLMLKSTSSLDTSFSEVMSPRENVTRVSFGQVQRVSEPIQEQNLVTSQPVWEDREVITKPPKLSESVETLTRHVGVTTEETILVPVEGGPKLDEARIEASIAGSDGDPALVDTSSCEEGTIMGSSGEEGSLRIVPPPSITNLLADALTEPSPLPREQSPISSERSDLVKIGSSEHTSGDELETTTSSDIEIISSPTPNGDSSSTASRHSPSKVAFRGLSLGKIISGKVKGHHREPSETSSGGSDECSEVDKLLKRIAEMTEIIEARESKLIDLSRLNADLQESNSELKSQLERQSESQEVKTISEEFTQRMAALERKFQQAIREKELLRKQLDHAKLLAVKREDDIDKDQLIEELRSEGEKLSKQQLTLNNAIKKLRATEKDNSKTIASLREQLNDITQELERTKKAVIAKEEMERSHIEAVHNLTKQNQQFEKEVNSLKANVAGLTSTLISTQKELTEKEEECRSLALKIDAERREIESRARADLSADLEASEQQVITLQSALEDMHRQIVSSQEQHSQVEGALRKEMGELLLRVENAERRAELQAEAAREASQPLARQLHSLSEAHATAQAAWHRHQAQLNNTINELESRLTSVTGSERSVREQYETAGAQIAALQDKATSLTQQNDLLQKELRISNERCTSIIEEKNKLLKKGKAESEKLLNELANLKRELTAVQELLGVERAALEAEKRKSVALQERLRHSPPIGGLSPRSSPTLSLGRNSVSESVSSTIWPNFGDDVGDSASLSGRLYDALRPSNNTSLIETLQAQLKLKEGEVQQLQWELTKRDSERTSLGNEVSELTNKILSLEEDLKSLSLLRTQYDALLQMYGEKLEESEELKMDLQDVKDMYKAQIDELLKKEPSPPASS